MTRTVFLGSPATALPSLRALADHAAVRLVGVVTQPDKPTGRGRKLQPCPVRAEAEALGLPVLTPRRIREPEALEALRAWAPELAIVCAYGQILPENLLNLPPLVCYNLHFSLLPRWRGASPVQAAILAGDATTGVSLQRMVAELDAGDVVAETPPLPIAPDDTAQSLAERLAVEAGALLVRSLPLLLTGDPPRRPQDPAAVTHCRVIRKEQGAVDFAAEDAAPIERKCRAYTPWPGCHAFVGTRRLGLVRLALADPPADASQAATLPGTLLADGRVRARAGWLRLEVVRPEGKGDMPFAAFRNGNPAAIGALLTPARA
ncbi:MAG TPA: methionyl-tRNA formyltransferase [bacterium]|nr:methionyl-tRNA formyltransferase [bacterium]